MLDTFPELSADTAVLGGYAVEDQVGFLLRRAHQRHAALFLDAMADAELTPLQFTALVKTVELGAVGQNQLGRLAAADPATIQGVVRRLIARALLTRAEDPGDRRAAVLTATEAGRDLVRAVIGTARAITQATLAPLDECERATILSLLRKLG